MTCEIRAAKQGDENTIVSLLSELASYERLIDTFLITPAIVRRDYLSERPLLHCDLAFEGKTAVGVASWYWSYSSFAAARALYLADLFVRPEVRGRGFGKAFFVHLAQTALKAGAVRMEWQVLGWNKPSIDFYESLGAQTTSEWLDYRLSGPALQKLAGA